MIICTLRNISRRSEVVIKLTVAAVMFVIHGRFTTIDFVNVASFLIHTTAWQDAVLQDPYPELPLASSLKPWNILPRTYEDKKRIWPCEAPSDRFQRTHTTPSLKNASLWNHTIHLICAIHNAQQLSIWHNHSLEIAMFACARLAVTSILRGLGMSQWTTYRAKEQRPSAALSSAIHKARSNHHPKTFLLSWTKH